MTVGDSVPVPLPVTVCEEDTEGECETVSESWAEAVTEGEYVAEAVCVTDTVGEMI